MSQVRKHFVYPLFLISSFPLFTLFVYCSKIRTGCSTKVRKHICFPTLPLSLPFSYFLPRSMFISLYYLLFTHISFLTLSSLSFLLLGSFFFVFPSIFISFIVVFMLTTYHVWCIVGSVHIYISFLIFP